MQEGPAPTATLEDAIAIAVEAHRGQTDKAGAPYILHPLRVMLAVATEEERMAAVLHDVLEDGGWTLTRLRQRGVPEPVLEALDRLTRREGESYEAFVARAAGNPISRRVKLADLEDNMDLRRLGIVTPRDAERLARYHRAWVLLTSTAASPAAEA